MTADFSFISTLYFLINKDKIYDSFYFELGKNITFQLLVETEVYFSSVD